MKMFLGRTALRQILVLLPVYANGITSGCIIGWAANVVYLLCRPDAEIKVTTAELWWMASMMEIGKMVFSIPAGILADRIGKENILTNVGIIHFTSWMMLSICSSVPLICLARFLAGLGTALLSASAMATIGEIASPEIRGMLAGLEQVFVMMGILSQALITAIYPSYNVLTYITVIISSIYFVTMFWLIETPPSLIKARKYNQARSNLRYLRPELTDKQVDDEYQQLKSYIEEQSILTSDMDCMHFIRSKSTFRPIAISVGINFFMLLTGVVVVLTYITEIVPQNDLVPKRFYPLIITGVSLFSTISTSFFVDKFPRRVLFMTAAAFTSVLQAYNGLTYYLFAHVGVQWCAWAFAIGNFLFRVHWAFLLLPVNGAMRSEIFPQNVKGIGNALSDMAQAAAITLSFKLYSYMSDDLTGLYYIFSSSAIILLILLYFYLPEGRGKSLVEIQKEKDVVIGNASLYMKQVP